jgi:hypothetical protein
MSVRKELADRLAELLPDEWHVIPYLVEFDKPAPATPAIVTVDRVRIQPTGVTRGRYLNKFEVILHCADTDPRTVDDTIDVQVDVMLEALSAQLSLEVEEVLRTVKNNYQAWVFNINVQTIEVKE